MLIDPTIWPKLHGASTHFPMALAMAAALFEGAGFFWPASSLRKAQLHAAGYFSIILGALGTFPAVLSGLFMTRGEVLGHDALLFHHLFVWPAFAGLVGLGVWRFIMDDKASPRGFIAYLIVLYITSGLMAGAGYWGGELILNSWMKTSHETKAFRRALAAALLALGGAWVSADTIQLLPGSVLGSPTAEPALAISPALAEEGHGYFSMSCTECHGDDAHGDEGPDLHNLAISNARVAATIRTGVKGEMPTFAKKYDANQIAAIVSYLRTLQ